MRIYRTIGSHNKFYNIKLNKTEELNLKNLVRIRANDPSYKGWIIQFFREIPNNFLLTLSRNRFIVLIYKNKSNNQIYAIVSVYVANDSDRSNVFGKYDYDYIRNKLINMYLNRKKIATINNTTEKKRYSYASRCNRKKTNT